MPKTGGRAPYDKTGALVGPARTLWAETTTAIPGDGWDVISPVADAQGEYAPKTGWNDFGLAADAPSYTHDKSTDGLSYQQSAANLFEVVSEITRSFTAQVAEIDPDNLKIMENAAAVETIAASINESAQKKVAFGNYQGLKQYRIAMVQYRPEGAGQVTEPAPSPIGKRPPIVMLVLPLVALAAEGTDVEVDRSDPVNMEIQFTAFPEPSLAAGKEHGFWIVEQPGVIPIV